MKNPSEIAAALPESPSRADFLAAALLSAAIFGAAHFQAFTNPYVINDDVKQQIYWMQEWLQPGLFQGDLLSDYARHYVPWGVKGLYWLASWAVGPIFFSKALTGILFVFLGACLYLLGATLSGRSLGWATAGVFWLMPFFLDNLSGGLARAFAAPLLALFWLCWQTRRAWGMGLALLLQGLFIPYIFMVGATAALLAWLASRVTAVKPPPFPARPAHWLLLAGGAALVLAMQLNFDAAGFGPLVSAAEMANNPEFSARGRYPILPVPSLLWELVSPWEFNIPFRQAGVAIGAALCLAIVGLAAWGARRIAWRRLAASLGPLGYLGLASLFLYVLARIFLLKLFIPDRYLIYTLNLAYCLGLALCLEAGLAVARWPRRVAVPALLALALLSCWHLKGTGLKDYSAYRPLYAALAATPREALIAGHPNLMDNVPTFGPRRAFATYKLAHVWSKGYWAQLRPRLEETFKAYYASDPLEVVAFCRKYQISYLIVDDRHFTPAFLAGGWFLFPYDRPHQPGTFRGLAERNYCPFFEPFDAQIRALTAGRRDFALLSPFFRPQVLDAHLRLVDMRPWLEGKSSP